MSAWNNLSLIFHGPRYFRGFSDISISCGVVLVINILFNICYNRNTFITGIMDNIFCCARNFSQEYMDGYGTLFISFLGFYIGFLNLISCFGFFAVTGYIPCAFILSFSVFICSIIFGLWKKGFKLISDLTSKDLPTALRIFFFPLELISVCIKPFSLGARLLFNIAIGHFVKSIIWKQTQTNKFFIGLFLIINLIEICTGILQSYMFMLFSSLLAKKFISKKH